MTPIQVTGHIEGLRETELACIVFVRSELDIALGFLRLAEAEMRGGHMGHAIELIGKASAIYRTAANYLGEVPIEFMEEKQLLQADIRELLESIRTSERHRRQFTEPLWPAPRT